MGWPRAEAAVAGAVLAGLLATVSSAAETQNELPGTIGKPFRVSASVTEYCSMKPPLMMCELYAPVLAEFFAETRDARWAPPVEILIFKSMLVKGLPRSEIRALECRRTYCALEYAVEVDDMEHNIDGNDELDKLMEPVTGVMAPELPTNRRRGKIVSVLIWRKRD